MTTSTHALKNKSLVLAALDIGSTSTSEDEAENDPPSGSLKRKLLPDASSGPSRKRRSVVLDRQTPFASTARNAYASVHSQHITSAPLRQSILDFNLNYDGGAPISRIDIAGPDQIERMADFVTKTIDNASQGATVQDAIRYLKLRDKKDFIPGMEVRLLPHQLIGCSWMLQQERERSYRGGVLADEMGLGKTVQMIATMAANMPSSRSSRRTTLIVVPAALLQQWKEEIDTKSNGIFDVHIHHGKDKLKTLEDLDSKDVIITTYQTLNNDFPLSKDDEDSDQWLEDNGGILAQMEWYRVVLDEAQFIRNRTTRSSKSVAKLNSKYRWMLTGTPITNTLADIYGLLRFGHFRPFNDWDDFNRYIARVQLEDAPLAGLRAQEVLKPILLRRTKDAELEGKPLLELPQKNVILEKLEFSEEERELYDSFEKRVKLRINKFIKERTIVKNHVEVLVLILRLRQLCCHPYLILSLAGDIEDPTLVVGEDNDKELARAMKIMGYAWTNGVKQRFLTRAKASEFDFSDEDDGFDILCPACNDILLSDNGRVLTCGHECCFDCLLEIRGAPIAHNGIFGYGNERQNARAEKEYETATAKGWRPCPSCKKMIDVTHDKVFKSSAFEPTEEELAAAMRASKKENAKAKPGRRRSSSPVEVKPTFQKKTWDDIGELTDSSDEDLPDVKSLLLRRDKSKEKHVKRPRNTRDSDDETADSTDNTLSSDADMENVTKPRRGQTVGNTKDVDNSAPQANIIATWNKGDSDLEPSTKMSALIRLLKSWSDTGDKCICYSQWTSMLDLIENLFARHGIQNLRYDGTMNREERERTLSTFKKAGGPKVMLISTKSGSVGLNLVSANRCVNMDLSWNYSSENQAFDRLHRLGQEKDVFIHRLVIKDTIEERMLRLQDTKLGLAEAALGEGSGIKLHKLSVKELKDLFGMNNDINKSRPSNAA